MTSIAFRNGHAIMRDGSVATGSSCCCVECCCNNITLNDLLYGDKEYAWETIKPEGLRMPSIGTIGEVPNSASSSNHCTDPMFANDAENKTQCCVETSPGVWKWTCGWRLRPGCLRWVCRCIDKEHNVVCSKVYGGSTVNNRNLTDLLLDEFGAETEHGCFVYTFEFFGWRSKKNAFVGRDDVYSVYKTKVTSCPS